MTAAGALYEDASESFVLGGNLKRVGRSFLAVGVAVTFQEALNQEVAAGIEHGWSGPEEWARAGLRSGLEVGVGYFGALVLGGAGALAAPPPWDLVTGAVGAGIGAGLGEQAGEHIYLTFLHQ